jgi:hypothetical protein
LEALALDDVDVLVASIAAPDTAGADVHVGSTVSERAYTSSGTNVVTTLFGFETAVFGSPLNTKRGPEEGLRPDFLSKSS